MLVDVAVDDVDSQCDISENYKDVSDNKHSTFIKISNKSIPIMTDRLELPISFILSPRTPV